MGGIALEKCTENTNDMRKGVEPKSKSDKHQHNITNIPAAENTCFEAAKDDSEPTR